MKRLFISDMDGTLLNSDGHISETTARLITGMSSHGALITVATARTPATVVPLMADTLTLPPAIVMTGAAMWNRTTAEFIHPRFIDAATEASILEAFTTYNVSPLIYTVGADHIIHAYFHGHPTRREQKFIDERRHLSLKKIHMMSRPALPPVYPYTLLVLGLGPVEAITPLADHLRASGQCSVSSYPDIFNHSLAYIEVFAPGVDKASAVTLLKQQIGADHLTVFGDNLNDLPMMAVADTSVAVANALPRVQEAADIVIGSNDNDAVARYIHDILTNA